jgi:hypothetical protein
LDRIEDVMTVVAPGRVSVLSHRGGVAVASTSKDPRLAGAAAAAVSFVATLVLATIESTTELGRHLGPAAVAMAVVVATSAWWARPAAAVLAGAFGWLMFNGFVVDQAGSLRWHGTADTVHLVGFVAIAASVALVHAGWIAMTRRVLLEELLHQPGQLADYDGSQGETHA